MDAEVFDAVQGMKTIAKRLVELAVGGEAHDLPLFAAAGVKTAQPAQHAVETAEAARFCTCLLYTSDA
ncbi:MAG: hypothetical protein KUG77_03670, partial [Nannocystaceae bacterium]|nr:hypothetical protein [Nannocystaceae bacterium]